MQLKPVILYFDNTDEGNSYGEMSYGYMYSVAQ